MWRTIGVALSAFLSIFLVVIEPAAAQRGGGANWDQWRWELLGATRIGGYGRDRDEINVGVGKGRFERVVLSVASGRVSINSLRIVFGNGQAQNVRLNDTLREGQRTRPIDLQGGNRAIQQIVIVGRARGGRAVVEVFGDPAPKWELIGKQRIGSYGTNLDTVIVGARSGPFTKIRLEARRQSVYIVSVRVAYNNGKAQVFRLGQRLDKDQATKPLVLSGRNRGIEHVEMVYRSRPGSGRAGIIEVYGEKARAPRPPPPPRQRWEKLGCQNVGIGADRDVIRVGRNEGRFDAIRLRANGANVYVYDLTVVYGSGQPDSLRVRSQIRAGSETKPLPLSGRNKRAIKQIELTYGSIPNFGGRRPELCVDGRR